MCVYHWFLSYELFIFDRLCIILFEMCLNCDSSKCKSWWSHIKQHSESFGFSEQVSQSCGRSEWENVCWCWAIGDCRPTCAGPVFDPVSLSQVVSLIATAHATPHVGNEQRRYIYSSPRLVSAYVNSLIFLLLIRSVTICICHLELS